VADDLELLAIQGEGSFDGRGRIARAYGVTIACAAASPADRQALWIGAEVPERLVPELRAIFQAAGPAQDPAQPPPALEPCARLLGAGLSRSAGPSFLIEGTPPQSPFHLIRSDASARDRLREANPGNWHPVEWGELLQGRLGPWVMAIEGDLVVSICHTPTPVTARAAECGVWTLPGFRGRGYAAAVTAEWAALLRPSGRNLFYSTDGDNRASQAVTRRLNLRLLGWTWRLARPRPTRTVHPLCSLHGPG
jgi:RimJ/RimL family protein N-acetyltransferase